VPIVSDIANNIGSAIEPAFTLVTKTATDALNAAVSFAGQIISKATGDVLTMSLDKVVYGQSFSGGNLLIGLGLFAATALSASYIAHLPPMEQAWKSGPSIEISGEPISLTQELIKPELQGLGAYGIGEAFGIKDPEALGIGTAAGSFAAPLIEAGTTSLFGHNLYNISPFYQMGSPAFAGSTAGNINSQLTGLLGGVVSYAAGHDFSLGQFGGTIVYEHNEQLEADAILPEAAKMGEYGYVEGQPGSGVLQVGVNGVAPATAQKLGLTLEQAQQALANFREANELGDNTPLPVIITDDGEMLAPLGSENFGNLRDYVPEPFAGTQSGAASTGSNIARDSNGNQLLLTQGSGTTSSSQTLPGTVTLAGGSAVQGSASGAPVGTAGGLSQTPDFIATENGTVFVVPDGATGPGPVNSGRGFSFVGGSGGNGLDSNTTGLRLMDPLTSGRYQYPNGYGVYMDNAGNTVDPYTGMPIPRNDPWAHIPIQ
jgi:hypothetical protein